MTKIIKKTFAILITVLMMISSFPCNMALAEDSASATEGSTTAEMTNDELKAYIEENIASASVKLPAETTLQNTPEDFLKGIVTKSSWKGPDLDKKIYSENNPNNFIKFSLNGLGNAVAVYTGENNDIRFPITANLYSNKTSGGRYFNLYIRNISFKQSQSNFQLGNEWWDRCIGENKLDPHSDQQQFSSKSNGDRKNPNASFNSQEKKSWRNYITYTGNGNTDSYYEKLPESFQFELQFECNKADNGYTETKTLPLNHRMYVLNMKPYKEIVNSLQTDYDAVKSNEPKYKQEALNNYYKAVRDIIDFDIRTYLSEVKSEAHVINAASAVKQVVENYNLRKSQLGIDFSTYNAQKKKCDIVIENKTQYTNSSFDEFKKIYDEVIVNANSVTSQTELDNLTKQLIYAQSLLRQVKSEIKFYRADDGSTELKTISENTVEYGTQLELRLNNIDLSKESVKYWMIKTDNGETVTMVRTLDTKFTLYVTKAAEVIVCVVPNKSTQQTEYSKVVFCGFNGKVIDVKYLKKDVTLESSNYTKAPEVPFYQFESWDKESVTGTGNDIFVRAKYTVKSENDFCTVHYSGFEGGSKKYSYDSYVSLVGATDDECYALATKQEGGDSILTYLNRNEFYAPRVKDIYVVKVNKEDRKAKIGITGSFAEDVVEDNVTKASAVFNCKFYLPEECKLIEWGAEISANGRTKFVKGDSISSHNEYTIRMKVSKSSSVKAFTGRAYVTYKQDGQEHTIYSDSVEQTLN